MAPVIRSIGVDYLSTGAVALTVFSTISGGPRWCVGQESSLFFDDVGAGRILAALARIPAYRDAFRAIADELDRREVTANADGTEPAERLAHLPDSPETDVRLRELIGEVVNETIGAM